LPSSSPIWPDNTSNMLHACYHGDRKLLHFQHTVECKIK
jgi:hypothetical protein